MIDNFVLALTHGLMGLAAWRLLFRPDLDKDGAPSDAPAAAWLRRAAPAKGDERA